MVSSRTCNDILVLNPRDDTMINLNSHHQMKDETYYNWSAIAKTPCFIDPNTTFESSVKYGAWWWYKDWWCEESSVTFETFGSWASMHHAPRTTHQSTLQRLSHWPLLNVVQSHRISFFLLLSVKLEFHSFL